MKSIPTAIALALMLTMSLSAALRTDLRDAQTSAAEPDNQTFIDANNTLMMITNQGIFGRDLDGLFGHDYGTFFPYTDLQHILDGSQIASPLYSSGLWMGGIDSATGELRVKVAEYNSEYWQGGWETAVNFVDNPAYHVYKIHRDSLAANPNADYSNWVLAARQGAPFGGDSVTPAMIGDQMCWTVYHDRDDVTKQVDAASTGPIGVEIRQTTFAFGMGGPLQNVIFLKFEVFNRGGKTMKDLYLSLWSDPDVGGAGDDLVGCDTVHDLGFAYNATNADNQYGANPPCIGYDFLQGPLTYTGNPADSGRGWGVLWPGYRNRGLASFNKYINGIDPGDAEQTYNYMKGLTANGSPYLYNGLPTPFVNSGDPVAQTGDLDSAPADRRMMQSTGPLTFRPGDSLEIIAAIIIGQGIDRLSSIALMTYTDQLVQEAFDDTCSVVAGKYLADSDGDGIADICEQCCVGTTGNVDMTGIVDLSDLSALVQYLTGLGYALPCAQEANVNKVGIVDLSDLSALISNLTGDGYIFPACP